MKNDVHTFLCIVTTLRVRLHLVCVRDLCVVVYIIIIIMKRDLLRKWNEENHIARIQSFGFMYVCFVVIEDRIEQGELTINCIFTLYSVLSI